MSAIKVKVLQVPASPYAHPQEPFFGNHSFGISCSCPVTQSCPALCDPMDCSMPGFPVLRLLPEFAQSLVHWVSDAIPPSHPLLFPSPPAFNLFQHQGLFQHHSSKAPILWCSAFFIVQLSHPHDFSMTTGKTIALTRWTFDDKSFRAVNRSRYFSGIPLFFYDPTDVGNLLSGSSAFSKSRLYIWKFLVHILLKTSLKNFEQDLASMWNE